MSANHIEIARRAAGDGYEILGELGRDGESAIAYLARENDTGQLVAVTLEGLKEAAARGSRPGFSVRRSLDPLIPAVETECPSCNAAIATWSRFCPLCRHDLGGIGEGSETHTAAWAAAKAATSGEFDLLGEMARAEGGEPIYFAREMDTGRIVALRIDTATDTGTRKTPTASVTQRLPSLSSGSEPSATYVAEPSAASDSSRSAEAEARSVPEALSVSPEPGARVNICPTCDSVYGAGVFFCSRDGTALRPKTQGNDMVGRTIAHRYRIVERLGQGGMGQVYKAIHVRMNSYCAIKIMNPDLESDQEALSRFAREAQHASRISHAHIARVYDFGETQDGLLFIAMEFAEGDALSKIIARDGALKPARAAEIARQVADALAAAHEQGTIHRDIKPDNIVVRASGSGEETAKVIDFGIAKAVDPEGAEQVTRVGYVVGNPKYMSPEQLIGDERIDERSDIYNLGCVLYEMLVGQAAFAGTTGRTHLTRRLTEPPPSPRAQLPSVPPELDAIVVHALARDTDDRFDSALSMREALEEYLSAVTNTASRRSAARRADPVPEGELQGTLVAATSESETDTPSTEPAQGVGILQNSGLDSSPTTPSTEKQATGTRAADTPVVGGPREIAAATAESRGEVPGTSLPHTVEPPPAPPPARPPPREVPEKAEAERTESVNRLPKAEPRVGPTAPELHPEAPESGSIAVFLARINTWPGRAVAGVVLIAVAAFAFWPRTIAPFPPSQGNIEILGDLPPGYVITATDAEGNQTRFAEASFSLAVGSYSLVFAAPGHEVDSTHVNIEVGSNNPWSPRLAAFPPTDQTGFIRLGTSLPAEGRAVARDEQGKEFELGPDVVELPVGRYVLVFDAPDYERYEEEILLAAGGSENWVPRRTQTPVEPTAGTVRITGNLQPGYEITAHGADGSTRPVRTRSIELREGNWTFRARAPGFQDIVDTVRVIADETRDWRLDWEPQRLSQASGDSVRIMIADAKAAATSTDFRGAYSFIDQAQERLNTLRREWREDAGLAQLDSSFRAASAEVQRKCVNWRTTLIDLGQEPPMCREPERTP